jgi:hypothetical protein
VPLEHDDDGFVIHRQASGYRRPASSWVVSDSVALLPVGHGLRIDPVAFRQRPQARLTVLDLTTDRLPRAGAPVENLAHSASLCAWEKTAPSKPGITQIVRLADVLELADAIVSGGEATPEEQKRYLQRLEKCWIRGVDEQGQPLVPDTGHQVSCRLKDDPKTVSFEAFRRVVRDFQPTVRACAVMPRADTTTYEYRPEQPVTKAEDELIAAAIGGAQANQVLGREHVEGASGTCLIDFGTNEASQKAGLGFRPQPRSPGCAVAQAGAGPLVSAPLRRAG